MIISRGYSDPEMGKSHQARVSCREGDVTLLAEWQNLEPKGQMLQDRQYRTVGA